MKAKEQVKKTIKDNSLIVNGDVLVLGFSGGPDSLALLHILKELEHEFGFMLCALHLNHCVRGEEADADEEFAKNECEKLGIPFKAVCVDVPALAKKQGISVEDCGRRERQKALANFCDELSEKYNNHPENLPKGVSKYVLENAKMYEIWPRVVLAHNQDDQAETVLLRIIRGSGSHGLSAMSYFREDGLIRPLLDTPRSEIEKYCEENGLSPRIDRTNLETDYTRNKLRLEVLPLLETINKGIRGNLVRLANNARRDDEAIEEAANKFLYGNPFGKEDEDEENKPLLAYELMMLPESVLARVLKKKFEDIGLVSDISEVHINALISVTASVEGNKTVEFPKGYTAYKKGGKVYFRRPGEK